MVQETSDHFRSSDPFLPIFDLPLPYPSPPATPTPSTPQTPSDTLRRPSGDLQAPSGTLRRPQAPRRPKILQKTFSFLNIFQHRDLGGLQTPSGGLQQADFRHPQATSGGFRRPKKTLCFLSLFRHPQADFRRPQATSGAPQADSGTLRRPQATSGELKSCRKPSVFLTFSNTASRQASTRPSQIR